MHQETASKKTERDGSRRCAVVKIDFNCRFVYVDAPAERLLGLPSENLFGRNIKEFLDEGAHTHLLSLLPSQNHYESFYEATRLTFIDARGDRHEQDIIISLNFIAGNPANYQLIINLLNDYSTTDEEEASADRIPQLLLDFIAGTKEVPDWRRLCELFESEADIYQAGLYFCRNNDLNLLADFSRSGIGDGRVDFNRIGKNLLAIARRGKPDRENKTVIIKTDGAEEAVDLIDDSYPLVHCGHCWGLIRLVHAGEQPGMKKRLADIAAFLGNALYAFAPEHEEVERVTL